MPRRDFPTARCGFPMARGGGQDLPRAETLPTAKASRHGARAKGFARAGALSSAKASRHGARAKGFAPRENAPLGEGLPTRRTSERICAAREYSPRRRPPDTAQGQKNLPRAGTLSSAKAYRHGARAKGFARARTLPSAKASRHGARAKGFAPRRNAPHGEGLPTRRTSERICPRRSALLGEGLPTRCTGERICPTRERSPRRRPPDTAHERKNLRRARILPTAKASRHGARAKEFAPRRNALLGEGLPTRRTSERICPAREGSPRRRLPDTAHERKDLPRAGTRPSAKASRHGARAKGFAPRGSRSPHVPTNGGLPSVDGQPKNTPSAGSHPQRARPLPSSFT